jgi:DNA adenine methylase
MRVPHPIPYQGSKRKLAPEILAWFPETVGTLYEPFAGSAAISLACAQAGLAARYQLSDCLVPLMDLWQRILDEPDALVEGYTRTWEAQGDDPRAFYDQIRDEYNAEPLPHQLLFLLARCVKNAVRFNRDGQFNQSPDKRRLGTRPARMGQNIRGAHALLDGKTSTKAGDYWETTKSACPRDLIYMDPPYQGTSGKRDQRYYEQLDYDRFVEFLGDLRKRKVPFIISFDGRTGDKKYGKDLPVSLGLTRVEIDAGRSSQATLSGRSERTTESLYLSPGLVRHRRAKQPTLTTV